MANVRRMVKEYRPQVVLHLAAAVGGIGTHVRQPGRFFYDNVMMGCQLMEVCRQFAAEKLLTVGTICSYPKLTPLPIQEKDFWNGYPAEATAPYGLAKKLLITQAEAYYREYGFLAVNVLLTNLYGPGDHFDPVNGHVIPSLICRFVEACERGERSIKVWGTGKATREFLYAPDAARGILRAVERLDSPAPINIGSGQETPIADLAGLIASKTGFRGQVTFDASKPDGQPRRYLDVSKAKLLLGFEATTSLSEGLDQTISWYRSSRHLGLARAA